jgi:hypothetical protein
MAQEWEDEMENRWRERVGVMDVKGQGMRLSED